MYDLILNALVGMCGLAEIWKQFEGFCLDENLMMLTQFSHSSATRCFFSTRLVIGCCFCYNHLKGHSRLDCYFVTFFHPSYGTKPGKNILYGLASSTQKSLLLLHSFAITCLGNRQYLHTKLHCIIDLSQLCFIRSVLPNQWYVSV